MISAKETNKLSKEAYQANIEKELDSVEKRIKEAISLGQFDMCIEAILVPVKEVLEKAGYKVEMADQYNDFTTFIDWS